MILRIEYEGLFNDTWDSLNQSNIDYTINMYKQWNNMISIISYTKWSLILLINHSYNIVIQKLTACLFHITVIYLFFSVH